MVNELLISGLPMFLLILGLVLFLGLHSLRIVAPGALMISSPKGA